MSTPALHASLLRPAIIHILRASGFHATKPSVVDSLTDVAARYMLLVASRTAHNAYDRTTTELEDIESDKTDDVTESQLIPTIADARMALASSAFFNSGTSASEDAWTEVMRRPLSSYPAGAREKERQRRDEEDTQDVREFVDWATGDIAKEIRRIAGLLPDEVSSAPLPGPTGPRLPPVQQPQAKDDYLDALKKKQSKSGDYSRYNGTALSNRSVYDEPKPVRIEGGPASLGEWQASLKRKRAEDG